MLPTLLTWNLDEGVRDPDKEQSPGMLLEPKKSCLSIPSSLFQALESQNISAGTQKLR